ncbi:ROK family protein [Pedobacter psychrodurus]|uniref:ROK family protein n=1 Tax=Pedobacter psychrodurus TaxID=2530456 RepID=A0A4R0PZ63_9SPHI|nr:ROK family protein [Pedobacter psychrodurus]TCD28530.1 ROK family protein [Pedobacter psychrodurus]
MKNIVMGVDIGGSHITALLIDIDKKEEIQGSWSRENLDSNASADRIIDAWAATIEKSIRSYQLFPARINIAMPGPMDYQKGICKIKGQGKYEALYGLNIKNMLAIRLGLSSSDINFVNDAASFLKGELFKGSLNNVSQAIGLTLGTGLGTAHTENGCVKDTDLWKMPFLKGVAEDYISTRWFIKRFHEMTGIKVMDVKDLVDNHKGSPYFNAVFLEFSVNLAKFLYKFIRIKMPLAVVIGGNIANAEEFFLENTRRFLASKMGYSFPVEKSLLGEKATLLGAGASI